MTGSMTSRDCGAGSRAASSEVSAVRAGLAVSRSRLLSILATMAFRKILTIRPRTRHVAGLRKGRRSPGMTSSVVVFLGCFSLLSARSRCSIGRLAANRHARCLTALRGTNCPTIVPR